MPLISTLLRGGQFCWYLFAPIDVFMYPWSPWLWRADFTPTETSTSLSPLFQGLLCSTIILMKAISLIPPKPHQDSGWILSPCGWFSYPVPCYFSSPVPRYRLLNWPPFRLQLRALSIVLPSKSSKLWGNFIH